MDLKSISLVRSLIFLFRNTWRKRGYWVRALLCLGIGIVVLLIDARGAFDIRYQVRGTHNPDHRIVLVNISREDIAVYFPIFRNPFRSQKDSLKLTDHFYWKKSVWSETLNRLLKLQVRAVAISFFFGDNVPVVSLNSSEEKLFRDSRVIWAAYLGVRDQIIRPQFALPDDSNIGLGLINEDEDGLVRRFSSSLVEVPHLAARLAYASRELNQEEIYIPKKLAVNFQGPAGTFLTVSLTDLLENRIPAEVFKDALVIVGAEANQYRHLTPVGPMSRAEILANMTDNVLNRKWISFANDWWYVLYLSLVLILSLVVFDRYPRSVAFIFILWIATLIVALSIWVFDSFYFWIPTLAPLLQLTVTWFTLVGYQATIIEQKNWRLRQERKYLYEVEQLKNNFVSLISHDLKTPIAKIQAIVDRLLTQPSNQQLSDDLKVIRRSSEELYRYIRSILHVTKVESRDFKLNKEVIDLNELVEKAVAQLDPLAFEKNLSITQELEPMFSLEVDVTLIQEVILNLVENAIRYTPNGGKIIVRTSESDNQVTLSVQDTGEGIAPEEQDRIWNKFTRGKEQGLKTKGTGLGLYLVKYFIELHNGRVFLDSQLGVGTKIGFILPVAEDSPQVSTNDSQVVGVENYG